MKVFTAPNIPEKGTKEYELIAEGRAVQVFLAGDITNCKNWQKTVIAELEKSLEANHNEFIIYNPRQENFDITNKNASYDQIAWEYNFLNKMDMFCMYFVNSESDQPICMYELGRYVSEMQHRFPYDWTERIIVFVEDGYKRRDDVIAQLCFATYDKVAPTIVTDASEASGEMQFAYKICKQYYKCLMYNDFYSRLLKK